MACFWTGLRLVLHRRRQQNKRDFLSLNMLTLEKKLYKKAEPVRRHLPDMSYCFAVISVFLLISYTAIAGQSSQVNEVRCYLFSYFKGNGEDGLHLAYSRDGFTYKALNNNEPFLKPQVGKEKLMRDSCVLRGPDDKFHMVWTVGWKEKGIGYASSPDLIRWSKQKFILVMAHEPNAQNCWAPELFYCAEEKEYIITWSTIIESSEKDSGSNHNHCIYYTTTSDFRNFSPTKLFYDPGFDVIDTTIIQTGDRYVMFFKDERLDPVPKKNIRLAISSSADGPYGPPSSPITSCEYWAEGPSAIRINETYIVYFDKYRKHSYGAVASDDLIHWDDISQKIHFPAGARHGTVFKVDCNVLDKLELYQAK